MCKVIEDMRREEREEGRAEGRVEERIEVAKSMLFDGVLPLKKIAEYAKLSLDEVKQLQAGGNA